MMSGLQVKGCLPSVIGSTATLGAGVNICLHDRWNSFQIRARAGASGFLAGRALWQEGVQIPSREERMNFFRTTAAPRLKELAELVNKYGRPWYVKMGAEDGELAKVAEDWYQNY